MLNVRERRERELREHTRAMIEELGAGQVAELLEVHRTTVERWLTKGAPRAVILALGALLGRLPGMESREWEGWTLGRDGLLYGPGARRGFHAGHILALPYLHQLIAHQKRQIQLLEKKLQTIETGAANDAVAGELGIRPSRRG